MTPVRFTTRGVPLPSRHRVLRTLADHGLQPVEPLGADPPEVDLVKWWLPGAGILGGRLAGVLQRGEPGTGDLFFGINLTGTSLARQNGRQLVIGPGDALAVDLRSGPFTVLRPAPCRVIGLRLAGNHAEGPGPRLVPAQTPALQLLIRYLRGALHGPLALPEVFTRHVRELVALGLAGAEPDIVPLDTVRAARLFAIKVDIEQHLTDGSLSAAAVAARHGISTRYLHKLFAQDAETYSKFVLHRRLELAHRQLCDPRYATRTVSAIAAGTGFGDLSYFNRTFRQRYGMTPSEARRARPFSGRPEHGS